MTMCPRFLLVLALMLTLSPAGCARRAEAAAAPDGFTIEILVDGRPVPEYAARGTRYVEALKGREYAIRLRNPLGVRVAVALSVDGLNTIDARRTTATTARKWVLGPYETVTIKGWQTGPDEARRFYFTAEEQSYAGRLGETRNIGIISAVFFRERAPEPAIDVTAPSGRGVGARREGDERAQGERPAAAHAGEAPQARAGASSNAESKARRGADVASEQEYAATGIGRGVGHRVQQVRLDLEPRPAASLSVRYEYRAQLVKLGVLRDVPRTSPLTRRERARGFEGFCPVP